MRYKTRERLDVGIIAVIVVINLALFLGAGWVIWHFVRKFW